MVPDIPTTDEARDKKVFLKELKGDPIGYDAFDNPLFVGDILIYATTQSQAATLKFGKITKLLEKDTSYHDYHTKQMVRKKFVKVQVRTFIKEYRGGVKTWVAGGLGIPNTKNALLMQNPPQEILDALEQFENEKGDRS